MTKKDYELIARVLRQHREDAALDIARDIAEVFADALAADNSRFDRDRFIAAATGA